MLRASTSSADFGFTLLEMMVSIAIIAMVLSAVPALYSQVIPQYELRQFANDVANESRLARQYARQTGRKADLLLNAALGSILVNGKNLEIPQGVAVDLIADTTFGDFSDEQISFYESGASSGGVLTLSDGPLDVSVHFDWVSGAIEVRQ